MKRQGRSELKVAVEIEFDRKSCTYEIDEERIANSDADAFVEMFDADKVARVELGLIVEVSRSVESERLESGIFCSASESSKNKTDVGEAFTNSILDGSVEGEVGAHAPYAISLP